MSVSEPLTCAAPLEARYRGPERPSFGPRFSIGSAAPQTAPSSRCVAPAGFGKTTLLAQWAERDPARCCGSTSSPRTTTPRSSESRLEAIADRPGALVLVDDVHVLRSPGALAAFERLLGQTAHGTTVAFAARRPPALPLARLRAEGRLLEIGTNELALRGREAETLLRRAGVLLPRHEAAALAERLEGWPAALFLAALSLHSGAQVSTIGGDDRFLADYLETEHLAGLSAEQRQFALQTSVLAELTSEACDSLLARSDSGRDARVPRTRRRGRAPRPPPPALPLPAHRPRPPVATSSSGPSPRAARALHRAAAGRAAEIGAVEEALEHAAAAGDVGARRRSRRAARRLRLRARQAGCARALARPVPEDDVETHPGSLHRRLLAARPARPRGQRPALGRHRDAWAQRRRPSPPRAARAPLPRRRRPDARGHDTPPARRCRPVTPGGRPPSSARAAALLLAGDTPRAETELVEAVELATAAGATELMILGLSLHSLLAVDEHDVSDAEAFAAEAFSVSAVEPPTQSLVALLLETVGARNSVRRGDLDRSRRRSRARRAAPASRNPRRAVACRLRSSRAGARPARTRGRRRCPGAPQARQRHLPRPPATRCARRAPAPSSTGGRTRSPSPRDAGRRA